MNAGRRHARSARRILIVRPDRIGDVVLTTPLVRALREAYPGAFLAALVRPYTRAVLEGNPHLDLLIEDDFEGRDRGVVGLVRLAARVRAQHFDTSLLVLPTARHAWLAVLAGIRNRVGVGRKPYEVLTGTRPAGRDRDHPVRHEADYCLDLARALGVAATDITPEVFLRPEEKAEGLRALELGAGPRPPVVMVHPGSGHSAPNWERATYSVLVDRLAARGDIVVVVSPETEGAKVDRPRAPTVRPLPGPLTLREFMGALSNADVLVSSSTGPMHLAAAMGIPCVALFCPRVACSPARWGPIGNRHRILVADSDSCRGCGPRRDPTCRLSQLSVDRVVGAVLGILGDLRSVRRNSLPGRGGCGILRSDEYP
jgi:heptosyltransferase-3